MVQGTENRGGNQASDRRSRPFPGIVKVISGGQTGADRAGLDAALALGVPHGGWCPRGRWAEDGVIARRYRLHQTDSRDYAIRTERNVLEADVTLIFTFGPARGGSAATIGFAGRHHRPWRHIDLSLPHPVDRIAADIVHWLQSQAVQQSLWSDDAYGQARTAKQSAPVPGSEPGLVLNVAGSRASREARIYDRVFAIVTALLKAAKVGIES